MTQKCCCADSCRKRSAPAGCCCVGSWLSLCAFQCRTLLLLRACWLPDKLQSSHRLLQLVSELQQQKFCQYETTLFNLNGKLTCLQQI